MNISIESCTKILELTKQGWDFSLIWGTFPLVDDDDTETNTSRCWEADFCIKKEDGFWDNYKSGYSEDVNEAIDIAYNNILNNKK